MSEPKVNCSFMKMEKVEDLKPHPKNQNIHPADQLRLLAKMIEYQGWRSPIVVSKRSGFITRGHARLQIAKDLGLKTVPVDVQDYVDEAQELSDLPGDNLISQLSEYSMDAVRDIALTLPEGFDFELLGIINFEIQPLPLNDEKMLGAESLQTKHKCPSCQYEW